jgi:hypothetical protein
MQTDTASVLMEAIGYIKFLQGQVEVRILQLEKYYLNIKKGDISTTSRGVTYI